MTIKRAREILAEYQALLDLGEWEIRVRWARNGELEANDMGAVRWCTDTAQADMFLRRGLQERELRDTIIHELVHVTLQGHADHTGKRDPMFERGINRITDAILMR